MSLRSGGLNHICTRKVRMMTKPKKRGCFGTLLSVIAFLIVFPQVLGGGGDKASAKSSIPTQSPTAAITASLNAPVSTPDSTEMPDYKTADLALAAQIVGALSDNFSCTTLDTTIDPDVIWVDVGMKVYDKRSNIQDDIRYCIDFAQNIFTHPEAKMIYIRFWELNENGEKTSSPISMRLTRENAALIDFDYFKANVTSELYYLVLLDSYSMSGEYKSTLH